MKDYEQRIGLAREKLEEAGALLIGAGAGLSAAAGLDYSGPDFQREFADYIKRYGFTDLYSSGFYPFPTPEEYWARWARHIDYIRFRPPALPLYLTLLKLARQQNYFVITTNVDHQFRKAGFDPARLFEVQGDYGTMQCARGCHPQIYENRELIERMLANTKDFAVESALLPVCPVCGGPMDLHLRKDGFFVEDAAWHEAEAHYEQFLEQYGTGPLVLLELGVGYNTPGIIRYPFEEIAWRNKNATLLRLNSREPDGPKENAARTISFTEDMGRTLADLAR